jgi:hypothetical protein
MPRSIPLVALKSGDCLLVPDMARARPRLIIERGSRGLSHSGPAYPLTYSR